MQVRFSPGFSLKVPTQRGGDLDRWGRTPPRGLMADLPEAYDTHFHLDRSLNKYGLPPTTSLGTFLRRGLIQRPRLPVKLTGGVVVFCEPSTWPQLPLRLEHGWKVAVGVHPKKALQLLDYRMHQLETLMKDPGVAVLGEVGVDHFQVNP